LASAVLAGTGAGGDALRECPPEHPATKRRLAADKATEFLRTFNTVDFGPCYAPVLPANRRRTTI